ncbi:MAG: hypothetical protein AAFZ18_23850, partial [Myxococcota bacterium]
ATLSEGCGGPPCRSPDDCPLGSYCVLRVGEGASSGECIEDCFEATDCPAPASAASIHSPEEAPSPTRSTQ